MNAPLSVLWSWGNYKIKQAKLQDLFKSLPGLLYAVVITEAGYSK